MFQLPQIVVLVQDTVLGLLHIPESLSAQILLLLELIIILVITVGVEMYQRGKLTKVVGLSILVFQL